MENASDDFPSKRSSKISFQTSPEVRHQFRRKLRQLHSGNRWCLEFRKVEKCKCTCKIGLINSSQLKGKPNVPTFLGGPPFPIKHPQDNFSPPKYKLTPSKCKLDRGDFCVQIGGCQSLFGGRRFTFSRVLLHILEDEIVLGVLYRQGGNPRRLVLWVPVKGVANARALRRPQPAKTPASWATPGLKKKNTVEVVIMKQAEYCFESSVRSLVACFAAALR